MRAFVEEEGRVRLGGAPEWLAEASLCGGMVERQQPGWGYPCEEDGADLLLQHTRHHVEPEKRRKEGVRDQDSVLKRVEFLEREVLVNPTAKLSHRACKDVLCNHLLANGGAQVGRRGHGLEEAPVRGQGVVQGTSSVLVFFFGQTGFISSVLVVDEDSPTLP